MYRVIVEQKAAKEINVLPDSVLQLVFDAIEHLKFKPRLHGVKKLVGEIGWRIRVRDYRILYTIDDKAKVITIYRVKHRKDAYR